MQNTVKLHFKFRLLFFNRSDKRMTLPSRFQKEVHTHLSRNPQQSPGESASFFLTSLEQSRKLGPIQMKQIILTTQNV